MLGLFLSEMIINDELDSQISHKEQQVLVKNNKMQQSCSNQKPWKNHSHSPRKNRKHYCVHYT